MSLRRDRLAGMRWVWSLGGLSVRELARRVARALIHEDSLGRAAELSYYFLVSLFPFLICLFTIVGMVFSAREGLPLQVLGYLRRVMPPNAYEIVRGVLEDVIAGAGSGRLSVALALALWTASLGMNSLITGLNVAYNVTEFRPWWRRRLVAIAITTAMLVLVVAALGLIIVGEAAGTFLAQWLPGFFATRAWTVLQWAIIFAFMLLGLSLIYLFAPNLKNQRWAAILPGALVACVCWLAASLGFRLYLHYFDTYSRTYGSLGAVIVLLLWLYLTGAAVLLGGEVNAQIRAAAAAAGAREAKQIREAEPS